MRFTAAVIAVGVVLFAVVLWFHVATQPPGESAMIDSFYRHRAQYDELRGMLVADNDLVRVRFRTYLALLKEIDATAAFRTYGTHPEIGVQAWASGFAGYTRHLNICWRENQPTNQVARLEEFYRTPKPRKPVYRHIEGNWYMWADW